MKTLATLLSVAVAASGCVAKPHTLAFPAETVAARLAAADAISARGCYLCLREAAGAYYNLVQVSDDPAVLRHTLQNDLMMALREVEMRLPDSGALARARAMASATSPEYDVYFDALDVIAHPPQLGLGTTMATLRQRDAALK